MKHNSNAMPIDLSQMPGSPFPEMAFGTGKFFEGLRHELNLLDKEDLMFASFEPAKYSGKRNGIITAYGANTN